MKILTAFLVFSLTFARVLATTPGGQLGIAVNPSGQLAFLNVDANGLLLLATAGPGGTLPVPGGQTGIALDPSGNVAFLHVDANGGLLISGNYIANATFGNITADNISGNLTGHSSLDLAVASNLSDVGNVALSKTHLGLGTGNDVIFNSVNGLTLTKNESGFALSGGNTTSKTLTIAGNVNTGTANGTLGSAAFTASSAYAPAWVGLTTGGPIFATSTTTVGCSTSPLGSAAYTASSAYVPTPTGMLTNGVVFAATTTTFGCAGNITVNDATGALTVNGNFTEFGGKFSITNTPVGATDGDVWITLPNPPAEHDADLHLNCVGGTVIVEHNLEVNGDTQSNTFTGNSIVSNGNVTATSTLTGGTVASNTDVLFTGNITANDNPFYNSGSGVLTVGVNQDICGVPGSIVVSGGDAASFFTLSNGGSGQAVFLGDIYSAGSIVLTAANWASSTTVPGGNFTVTGNVALVVEDARLTPSTVIAGFTPIIVTGNITGPVYPVAVAPGANFTVVASDNDLSTYNYVLLNVAPATTGLMMHASRPALKIAVPKATVAKPAVKAIAKPAKK